MKEFTESFDKLAQVCSRKEFSARELFKAFDADGDGVITKSDLKILAQADGEKNRFSRKDLKLLYSSIGKKIVGTLSEVMQDEGHDRDFVTVDELFNILDKNANGKIKLGDFLRIAKKDGDLMFITNDELESEFEGIWHDPEKEKNFFQKLFGQ